MAKILVSLILLASSISQAYEIRTQCDSAAEQAARLYAHKLLRDQGTPVPYPGPEVATFTVLSQDNEYRITLAEPLPITLKIGTAQKSYYCAIIELVKEN